MAEFKDMLKFYREERGLSQAALARAIGVSPSTISMYEVGKREPDFETEEMIADFFNVSISNLRGKSTEDTDTIRVPVLGSVAAGIPIEMIEDIVDWEELDSRIFSAGSYFGLRIKGDSMAPRILDGDTVIVRRQDDADSGEVAIVTVNGDEATCKRIRKLRDGIELIPINASFPPRFFSAEEVAAKPVRIIGKVVELRAKF